MADNLIEYTPLTYTPNMTGPAWPDNARKVVEMTPYELPVEKQKSDKKKTSKKKRWEYDPTVSIPWPSTELEFGRDRLAQARRIAALPTGPFEDNLRVPRVGMPVPSNTRIAEDRPTDQPRDNRNWFQRLFGPDQSELEAERNGLRWHWALEHRFMPPGSRWNETVWNGVDRENAWLAELLQQQKLASGNGSNMSPIAKQRELSRISGQYDKLVSEYLKGNWDDPERAYQDFLAEAERLRKQYAEQGGAYEDLRLPPPVAGGRSGFTTQSRPAKLREQYNFAKSVNKELASWLDVDPKTGKRKIDNPKFVQEKKFYLDSVYERILKHIKDSSNAMADEEKQRLQILVLPDNAMDEVIKEVKGYQAALRGIMSSAAAKEWSQNNKGKVNEVIKALGFEPSGDKTSLGQQLATLGGIIVASLSKNNELPHDVATNLQAAKDKFDTYMKNMMLSATVAPHIVANITALLGNTLADEYNDQARVADRDKADYLDTLKDISGSIPRDAMPLSELIKHSDYRWPSLNTVSNAKISTQAESKGETAPVEQYADVSGVGSTIDYERYK